MIDEIGADLKYTETHEWIKVIDNTAIIGITDHAQSELTDIVFVELPKVGKEVKKGEELCVVESVKSVSEIYAPLSGKILKINEKLEEEPEIINKNPYGEGWLVEMKFSDESELDSLLTQDEYKKMI